VGERLIARLQSSPSLVGSTSMIVTGTRSTSTRSTPNRAASASPTVSNTMSPPSVASLHGTQQSRRPELIAFPPWTIQEITPINDTIHWRRGRLTSQESNGRATYACAGQNRRGASYAEDPGRRRERGRVMRASLYDGARQPAGSGARPLPRRGRSLNATNWPYPAPSIQKPLR